MKITDNQKHTANSNEYEPIIQHGSKEETSLIEMVQKKTYPAAGDFSEYLMRLFRRHVNSNFNPHFFVEDINLLWDYFIWPTSNVSLILFDKNRNPQLYNARSAFNNPRTLKEWGLNKKNSLASHVIKNRENMLFFVVPRIWIAPTYGMFPIPKDYETSLFDEKRYMKSEVFNKLLILSKKFDLKLVTHNNAIDLNRGICNMGSAVIAPLQNGRNLAGLLFIASSYIDCFISDFLPPKHLLTGEDLVEMVTNITFACYDR